MKACVSVSTGEGGKENYSLERVKEILGPFSGNTRKQKGMSRNEGQRNSGGGTVSEIFSSALPKGQRAVLTHHLEEF